MKQLESLLALPVGRRLPPNWPYRPDGLSPLHIERVVSRFAATGEVRWAGPHYHLPFPTYLTPDAVDIGEHLWLEERERGLYGGTPLPQFAYDSPEVFFAPEGFSWNGERYVQT